VSARRVVGIMVSIQFRFIRKGLTSQADKRSDDICTVTQIGHDEFSLKYRYIDATDKPCFNTTRLDSAGVCRWVRRALDLIERDADPFENFQIDFPLLPSIMFSVDSIWGHYRAILDATEFSLDNWPETPVRQSSEYQTPVRQTPVSQNMPVRHSVYHYTSAAADDNSSVSTHSSMPSLVSYHVQTRSRTRRHLFTNDAVEI